LAPRGRLFPKKARVLVMEMAAAQRRLLASAIERPSLGRDAKKGGPSLARAALYPIGEALES
jgi:hypothetical protein